MATISSTPAVATAPPAPSAWQQIAGIGAAGGADFAFGNVLEEAAAALGGNVVAPLAHLGAIAAAGADAEAFLQNQLSSDLRELSAARAQLSSYNSPKGRVLALFALLRHGDGVLLETRRDILAATLKRLRMFVLRSKVSLQDASDALPALGLAGPDAPALLGSIALPAPAQAWQCEHGDGVLVVRRPGAIPRFTLHADSARMAALWQALRTSARPVGSAAWRLLEIRAGLPSIGPATADQFVPQMLNLDRLGAISFGKGCYPGQEIVARLHYLGNLKRRLFAGTCDSPTAAAAMPVYADGEAQAVGAIVDAAPDAAGGSAVLAVLQLGLAAGTLLRAGAADGAPLHIDYGEAGS